LLRGLRPALAAADQLSLVYQPRVDMRSGECLSAEALLRWQHPTLGDVSPGEFIPLAEQTGMIRFITDWVVARALGEWAAQPAPERPRNVSINISPLNLGEENFAGRLGAAISRHGLAPGRVELEFTETALLHDTDPVSKTVRELAGLGVGIAIDDFGTGYSNLAYLKQWPVDFLKIDRRFVRDVVTDMSDLAIVAAIIAMARHLHIKPVAEGIEGWQQLEKLRQLGCNLAQGYLFARPAPAQQWASLLRGQPLSLIGRDAEVPLGQDLTRAS
jgi:EAL domain-containing protein (putative c-di-GMP-specific phosphodiesterase class I)